ncbi:MAG TPA: fimbrial protein [Providencia sp.]|uniref:fimbrial protein n=1 Tax=Providencia sp. TaxID=589 RepID=UPI000E7DBE14|nr:fimbrial protein [Providencia sp.]MBP6081115.1 fimbrial protein [Providencia sp.]HBO24800.1 fimbrial protein [Providencia sp.]
MSKQEVFIKIKWFGAALFIVGSVLGQLAMAKSPVANTPVNQSDYEPLHQGRVQVRAMLFNAPCNLSFKKVLSLTGCGAGKDYQKMNLLDTSANTPVSVRFYDVQRGVPSVRYPISLSNGSNPIHIPMLMKDQHTLRLEVSYE